MTPSDGATLIGMVTQFRADMTERFNGVDCRLDLVDGRISKIETSREVEHALAVAAKAAEQQATNAAERHTLALRWRLTLIVAAGGSAATLLLGIARFATGH